MRDILTRRAGNVLPFHGREDHQPRSYTARCGVIDHGEVCWVPVSFTNPICKKHRKKAKVKA